VVNSTFSKKKNVFGTIRSKLSNQKMDMILGSKVL
jgi:hypothetical protein